MTILLETPQTDTRDSFAGGVATVGDIYGAARDNMIFVDNTLSADAAMTEAYDRRIQEVLDVTGQKLRNPYLVDTMDGPVLTPRGGGSLPLATKRQWFTDKVAELTANIPDRSVADRLQRSIDGEAIGIAREANERLSTLSASRSGMVKWAAMLAGSMTGSLRDPVQLGALALGGGPGGARTVLGRILTVAAKEALINGATEAAMQPMVQAWREKIGVDHGVDVALQNVLFASLIGAGFGGLGAGAAEALRPLLRGADVDRAARFASGDEKIAAPIREALAGDGVAARDSLATIREALPPAARGAIDEAEKLRLSEAQRPQSVGPEHHDVLTSRADAAAEPAHGEAFRFEADPEQVRRIADELAGSSAPPLSSSRGSSLAGAQPQSLVPFLAARGILDDRGELAAIGAGDLTKNRARRGKPDTRIPLDMAREAAEEAGYIGRPGETQTTTVRDLVDAIDQELRGNKIYSREDQERVSAAGDVEGDRARVESLVSEIVSYAGPAVDDATVKRIAELATREGLDPADAVERVLTEQGRDAGAPAPALVARQAEDNAGELPEPGHFEDDYELSDADLDELEASGLEIPFFDDEPIGAAQLREELKRADGVAAVAAACRVA